MFADRRKEEGRLFGEGVLVEANEATHNIKLGFVNMTYAGQGSCPSTCPLKNGGGCYAENGGMRYITRRLNKADPSADPEQFALSEAKLLDAITQPNPTRLHAVGDCSTDLAAIIVGNAVYRLVLRIRKIMGRVWTYTHAWREVSRSSWGWALSVLASCHTLQQAKQAMQRGYAASVIVEKHPEDGRAFRQDGLLVIPCPSQTRGVQCTECRLCWNDRALLERGAVIAFEAHGRSMHRVIDTIWREQMQEEGGRHDITIEAQT